MIQIITAPDEVSPIYLSVFLAGGITNCDNWQEEVIDELKYNDITVFNPRRENFDIKSKAEAYKQIGWEYRNLERADVFSMYFCAGESDQPICMYELGRNIIRMQNRFPNDWYRRIVVSVEEGYKRELDVFAQLGLCAPNLFIDSFATPGKHASHIHNACRNLFFNNL